MRRLRLVLARSWSPHRWRAAPASALDLGASACHAALGGAYKLQPEPQNGAPQWLGPGGAALHWDPSYPGCGCPAWAIAEDGLHYLAPAEGLPMGAAPWNEFCDHVAGYPTVSLAAAASAAVPPSAT